MTVRLLLRSLALAVAVPVALSVALSGCTATASAPAARSTRAAAATPTPTPTDASGRLLAAADAKAGATVADICAVSFTADGTDAPPQLQQQGVRFDPLPIPQRPGLVFDGWYTTPAAAAAQTTADRVNGARLAECTDRRLALYGGWETPEQLHKTNARIPILMYHQFTTKPQGESGWLRGNYIYSAAFDKQLAYIAQGHFYLPTWDELNAFIDGRLALPQHSVIITDDDARPSWFSIAVPIVDKYRLLTTSFVITKNHAWPSRSIWVQQRSHTNDMHRAGANGKGRMVNLPASAIAADMEKSAQILGAKEVMAYPFGQYDATSQQGLREAGFDLAVTTESGYVVVGSDKLALPRMRMSYGETVTGLADAIG